MFIKILRTDNGSEYINVVLGDFFINYWDYSSKFMCSYYTIKWSFRKKE